MNAALGVVDQVGLPALTIRAVAAAVNAPPMSLYTHFSTKEELIDLMYVAVADRLYVDSGHDTWQAELSALGHHVRETLLAHPRWAPILSRPSTPTAVGVRERVLAMMVANGFSAPVALSGLSSVVLSAIGLVLVELTFRDAQGGSTLSGRFERLKALFASDAARGSAPTTSEAFARVPSFDLSAHFDFSLEALIRGLERSHPGQPGASQPSSSSS